MRTAHAKPASKKENQGTATIKNRGSAVRVEAAAVRGIVKQAVKTYRKDYSELAKQ